MPGFMLCLRNAVLPFKGNLKGTGGLLAVPLRLSIALSTVPRNEGKFSDSNMERRYLSM